MIQYILKNGTIAWSTTRAVPDNYNINDVIAQIKYEMKTDSNNFGAHSVRLKYGPDHCNELESNV